MCGTVSQVDRIYGCLSVNVCLVKEGFLEGAGLLEGLPPPKLTSKVGSHGNGVGTCWVSDLVDGLVLSRSLGR